LINLSKRIIRPRISVPKENPFVAVYPEFDILFFLRGVISIKKIKRNDLF